MRTAFTDVATGTVLMLEDATERNNSIPKRVIVGFQLLKRESTMGRTATTGFTTKTRTEATMTANPSQVAKTVRKKAYSVVSTVQ